MRVLKELGWIDAGDLFQIDEDPGTPSNSLFERVRLKGENRECFASGHVK